MKRFLAPILLLTLLFPALAYGVTMDELLVREGLHYEKFTDVPFTGKVTGNTQGSFRKGKEHGPWVYFWSDGQLRSKGTYKDGKMDGPWVSYLDNGQLLYKGDYKNGKKHGPWVSYYDNGQLLYKGDYKNGKREGRWVFYNEYGTKRFFPFDIMDGGTGTYRNGKNVGNGKKVK